MPKTKWDGTEEPTIKNFYKIDKQKIFNMLLKVSYYLQMKVFSIYLLK